MTMSAYEERKQARIERLQERADKLRAEGEARMNTSSQFFYNLNGQPLLPGHYSYKSDRNRRERFDNMGRKGYEMTKQADDLERRAESAASNRAISSDDPNAPDKLRAKIERLERLQAGMVAANKIVREKPKNEPTPDKIARIVALGMNEDTARELFTPDFCGRYGFPSYATQNNNAKIKTARDRLAVAEAMAAERAEASEPRETEYDGFTVCEDIDMNRVQIIFPGKPDAGTRSGWLPAMCAPRPGASCATRTSTTPSFSARTATTTPSAPRSPPWPAWPSRPPPSPQATARSGPGKRRPPGRAV